ncbi:MAG TPA: rhomboid family intramembrane serine protease [Terriglobales bacterium]|nr:rhomboid family intramembrane serine protease [Terriglobales bacterium]
MIPLRDDAPRFSTPWMNYFLIALNTAIFLAMWAGVPAPAQVVVNVFGFVPLKITALLEGAHAIDLGGALVPVNAQSAIIPIFTSMFLHASWLHLIGNMWGLWIFGDNVEDHLGHFAYILFYLLCGIGAAVTHTLLNLTSAVPSVGASGAIAGVMGAYFVLYPRARVLTLVPLIFFFTFWWLPAWVVLGYWFLLNFFSGAATSVAVSSQTSAGIGGVAFWAHVGGFITGMLLVKLFPVRQQRSRYAAW